MNVQTPVSTPAAVVLPTRRWRRYGGAWQKQSGVGRPECLEELIAFTQEKNIGVNLKRPR